LWFDWKPKTKPDPSEAFPRDLGWRAVRNVEHKML